MDNTELDQLRFNYKAAVERWIAAIRAEENLATPDHSMIAVEDWDQANFTEEDARRSLKPRARNIRTRCAKSSIISRDGVVRRPINRSNPHRGQPLCGGPGPARRANAGVCSRKRPYAAITAFHELVIDAVADLVPAVKPQLAFFEQYGVAGMQAFENTVLKAKQRGLLVIADGKRNDISSTAEAYANAYLGGVPSIATRLR